MESFQIDLISAFEEHKPRGFQKVHARLSTVIAVVHVEGRNFVATFVPKMFSGILIITPTKILKQTCWIQ